MKPTKKTKKKAPAAQRAKKAPGDELQPKDFEKKIQVRQLRVEDHDELVAMQALCFPGMPCWGRDQIESQIRTFPEGQICIEYGGRIVASAGCLIVDSDLYSEWHSWPEISDHGYIRNHDPEGDTLYGIEIMVHPGYRGLKLARRLYEARKDLARSMNVGRSMVGGRIPDYGKYAEEMSAREYVEQVIRGGLYDPVLTTQTANGFVLQRLIPDYLPMDDASRGYATCLEWINLDYVPDTTRQFQAVSLVRVCAVQYQMRNIASFEEFAVQCEFFVDVASEAKADFVVFPELLTTQLLSIERARRPSEAARKLADRTPEYLELFSRLAIKYNVNIVGGSQFTIEEEELYNVSYLFRRDGTLDRQYKLHITASERRWWGIQPGKDIRVFDTDRGKIAILLSYDVQFPELSRIVTSLGAQILFVPFNTESRESYLSVRTCARARCVENGVYTVIAGCIGNLPFVENADVHYAQSAIFTPHEVSFSRDGIAAECTPNIELVLTQDLDLALLRRQRHAGTVSTWSDRRKDLYKLFSHTDTVEPDVEV
jgi:predicted amidohydrolase/GNAT superfamily N-acetyltransferase